MVSLLRREPRLIAFILFGNFQIPQVVGGEYASSLQPPQALLNTAPLITVKITEEVDILIILGHGEANLKYP